MILNLKTTFKKKKKNCEKKSSSESKWSREKLLM